MRSARAAMIEPLPLMMPVTVPNALAFPLIVGCSDKSAATADVMMLFGPPTRHPMIPSRISRAGAGRESPKKAKKVSSTMRAAMNVAITHARRPP